MAIAKSHAIPAGSHSAKALYDKLNSSLMGLGPLLDMLVHQGHVDDEGYKEIILWLADLQAMMAQTQPKPGQLVPGSHAAIAPGPPSKQVLGADLSKWLTPKKTLAGLVIAGLLGYGLGRR